MKSMGKIAWYIASTFAAFLIVVVAWPLLLVFSSEPRGERVLGGDEDL